MKTLIAIIIAFNTVAVFAVETESKCGQVADSVERSNPKTDSGSAQTKTATEAAAQ